MAKENKTKYVILGLLEQQPLTGYAIREIINESTAHFWQESDASVYPALKLLTQEKLVTSETAFVGKRKKEIFTITDLGKKEFVQWFKRLPEVDMRRQEFLLKLFFATKKQDMQKHFAYQLNKLEALLKEYKEIEIKLKKEFPGKIFWMKTLQNGIAHTELDIAWIQQQLKGQ